MIKSVFCEKIESSTHMASSVREVRRATFLLLLLAYTQQPFALSPAVIDPSHQRGGACFSSPSSRRGVLLQWIRTAALPAALLLPSAPAAANAACAAGDFDVARCLGYYRQLDDGSGAAVATYQEAAEAVAADLEVVKGWRALVGQSRWEEVGAQLLALTPRLRRGSNLYCEALVKEPLKGGGFEGMSAFRQVETCRYAYEDANAALFAFEGAVAAAYRSSSAGVSPGGAGGGGGGVLTRFGGAGTGGAGATLEQSLAALSSLKELEVRMYVLAASLGLVTLRMEPEVVQQP